MALSERDPRSPLPRITGILLMVGAGGLAGFELMHRVLGLPQPVSALVVGLGMLPALLWALFASVASVLADPDELGHAIGHAFAYLAVTIVFFAVIYMELGLRATGQAGEVVRFWPCLYFSVTTITTAGFGDFVPTPEARIPAAVETVVGYVVFGVLTAATFFLIAHRTGRGRGI
jgi:hypothetical protein